MKRKNRREVIKTRFKNTDLETLENNFEANRKLIQDPLKRTPKKIVESLKLENEALSELMDEIESNRDDL